MSMIVQKEGFVLVNIRVITRASKSEIAGVHDGAVRVRIASPPVDGAANAELVNLLAKAFCVARSRIAIVSGAASKTKQMRIDGVKAEEIRKMLNV